MKNIVSNKNNTIEKGELQELKSAKCISRVEAEKLLPGYLRLREGEIKIGTCAVCGEVHPILECTEHYSYLKEWDSGAFKIPVVFCTKRNKTSLLEKDANLLLKNYLKQFEKDYNASKTCLENTSVYRYITYQIMIGNLINRYKEGRIEYKESLSQEIICNIYELNKPIGMLLFHIKDASCELLKTQTIMEMSKDTAIMIVESKDRLECFTLLSGQILELSNQYKIDKNDLKLVNSWVDEQHI